MGPAQILQNLPVDGAAPRPAMVRRQGISDQRAVEDRQRRGVREESWAMAGQSWLEERTSHVGGVALPGCSTGAVAEGGWTGRASGLRLCGGGVQGEEPNFELHAVPRGARRRYLIQVGAASTN